MLLCTPPASENYFAMSDYSALDQKLNQFTSRSCSEPVTILPNKTITVDITKDKYKFIKVAIVIIGNRMLIRVKLFNGNVKIFHSLPTEIRRIRLISSIMRQEQAIVIHRCGINSSLIFNDHRQKLLQQKTMK